MRSLFEKARNSIEMLKEVCYEKLHYESSLYKSKPKTSTSSWT